MTRLLDGWGLYKEFLLGSALKAKRSLWLATADLKDLHVPMSSRRFIAFPAALAALAKRGVEIRLLHAKEPGPRFRRHFDDHEVLRRGSNFERALCPRVHFKIIIVDFAEAYMGSANLTGAGIGAKSRERRNFEAGIVTNDSAMVAQLMRQFDEVFFGKHCAGCGRRSVCPDPIAP